MVIILWDQVILHKAGNNRSSPTNKALEGIERQMKNALMEELKNTRDPRVVGPDKEVFDSYMQYTPVRKFPPTE